MEKTATRQTIHGKTL